MNSVLSSVKWSFFSSIVRKVFSFAIFLFIARIFDRDLIGVYREFAVLIAFFASISMFSLNTLIVIEQKANVLKKALPFVITFGFILSFIVTLFAPVFGRHYQSEILTQILYWAIPFILIEIIRQTLRAELQNKMKFKFLSIAETFNVLFYCVLTILIVPFYHNIKIFIFIFYLGNLLELIMLYYHLKSDLASFKSFFRFTNKTKSYLQGLKESILYIKTHFNFLFFSSSATTINMLMSEFPVLILGVYFNPENIGNYFIAFQVVIIPCGLITQSLSQVFTSKFSKLDLNEFSSRLDRFYFILLELLIPAFLIYCLIIREFLYIFFGNNNIEEIRQIVLILFFMASSLLIMNPLHNFFAVLRKTHIEFIWSVSAIVITNTIIFLNRNLNFLYVLSIFVGLSVLIRLSFNIIVFKYISYSLTSFFKKLLFLLLKVSTISIVWFILSKTINYYSFNNAIMLLSKTSIALIIFLIYCYITNLITNKKLFKECKAYLAINRY